MQRRQFLNNIMATGLVTANAFGQQSPTAGTTPNSSADASKLMRVQSAGELKGEMLYRPFGRTGETVSAIGLGGSHIGKATVSEEMATRLIHQAIDRALPTWTTPGTTTRGGASGGWETRLPRTSLATRYSS